MANLKKIGSFLKRSLLITLAAGAVYYAGLKQNPSFQELTPKVQQVLIQEHNQLDNLLKSVSDDFIKGNFKEAMAKFGNCEKLVNMLSKIDPKFNELKPRLAEYQQFINLIGLAVDYVDYQNKYINNLKIDKISSESILNIVTRDIHENYISDLITFSHNPGISPEIRKLALSASQQFYKERLGIMIDLRDQILKQKNRVSSPKQVQQIEEALRILNQMIIPRVEGQLEIIEQALKRLK